MPGVLVQLWNSGKTELLASTTTDANGSYSLTAPMYGDYRLRFVWPNLGFAFSPKDQGSDTQDSDVNPSGPDMGFTDVINIASNVISISKIDAGLRVLGIAPTPTPPPPPPAASDQIYLPIILR